MAPKRVGHTIIGVNFRRQWLVLADFFSLPKRCNLDSKNLYLRLLAYVRPHWRMFALSIATMVIMAATEPVLPALMKPMLDGSFVSRDLDAIRWIPLALIALFLVRGVVMFISNYAMADVGTRLVMDLRRDMFDRLVMQPTRYFDDATTGHLVSTLAFNVTQVTQSATVALTSVVRDSLTILGLVGWMFYINWRLALITLVLVPAAGWVFSVISRRLRKTSRLMQQNLGDITHVLEESIAGHKVIKVFDGQDYERGRFFEAINQARKFAMKSAVAAYAHSPILQMMAAFALAAIVYAATMQAAADQTTVGGFVSFITAMLLIAAPMKRLSSVNEAIQRGLAAAEDVFRLLDQAGEPDTGRQEIGRARGELRFEDIALTYDSKSSPALDGIDLVVEPGETVALVGPSGSGKTTLVNLIPRFYCPSRGRILLDGVDLREIKLASLRANIALVSQEVILFNDSVAANIAYGRQDKASMADIRRAAEAAHALGFIEELPQGFATLVGERGVKLSGGQRQRIAIARALLKDAPILILDEATSALDTESERHVQAALENLMQGRTTLVIAHRLSTVERADRIVVLDRGRIAEQGSHAELIARGGIYSRLYALQFQDDAAAD
ncbi:subfamily B ATP-binding cassette protein MsbA [Sulfuritortus calidifontis]|uniref:Subfamily B ATP-binding cassette protein MsbA n=2 Tax=Sulfuritortus calidifontis TaxID=1914471 RepID=A0A4V2UQR2_9PROT|nr:subfamily B ATP-binding cassette protein MsbA [Sulfuritortus calidifontis]